MELRPRAQGVSQAVNPGIEQADDVPGPGFLHGFALVRHELLRLLESNGLVGPAVPHFHAFFKGTADNPHEGQPVPVGGIHVGLNLENKSGEVRFFRRYHALVAFPGQGRRRKAEEPVQEGFNTEVGHRRSEEHGGQLAAADLFQVKGVSCFVQQLDFLAETVAIMLFQGFFQCGIINGNIRLFNHLLAVIPAGVQFHRPGIPVINALEVAVNTDRPVDRAGCPAPAPVPPSGRRDLWQPGPSCSQR